MWMDVGMYSRRGYVLAFVGMGVGGYGCWLVQVSSCMEVGVFIYVYFVKYIVILSFQLT